MMKLELRMGGRGDLYLSVKIYNGNQLGAES